MAYKKLEPGRVSTIPDEQLHPVVREALAYFEKKFHETYKWKQGEQKLTWEMMRPRMIRVIEDLYELNGTEEERMPWTRRISPAS